MLLFKPAGTLEDRGGRWCGSCKPLRRNWALDRQPDCRSPGCGLERGRISCCIILDDLDVLPDEVLRLLAAELRRFRNSAEFGELWRRLPCILLGGMKLLHLTGGPESPLSNVLENVPLPDLTAEEAARSLSGQLLGVPLTRDAACTLFLETADTLILCVLFAIRLKDCSAKITSRAITRAASSWPRREALGKGLGSMLHTSGSLSRKPTARHSMWCWPCWRRARTIRHLR